MKKLTQATLEARAEAAGYTTTQLTPGDAFLVADGGKHGNSRLISGLFKDDNGAWLKHDTRTLQIIKSEECITDRMPGSRRGIGSISQNEHVHVVALEKMKLPVLKKLHFQGTNKGDTFGFVPLPGDESCWQVPHDEQLQLIDKYIIRVGGKEDSDDDCSDTDEDNLPPAAKKAKQDPKRMVRAFHHEQSKVLIEEYIHCFKISGIIDLSVGPCTWAQVAVEKQIPYFGLCLSPAHLNMAYKYLEQKTDTYLSGLAVKPPPIPKPKPKPKPKAKAKKPKSEEPEEGEEEGSPADSDEGEDN